MQSVGVLYGGPSPEHDVSVLTGLQAARVLCEEGFPTQGLYWSRDGRWYLVPALLEADAFVAGVPETAEPLAIRADGTLAAFQRRLRLGRVQDIDIDVIFNCCHGGPGEDGTLQGWLDLLQFRYTGPSARAAALGMDKLAFSGVMAACGIPTLPRAPALLDNLPTGSFPPPWIMKPRFGGSSIGIAIVEDEAEANRELKESPHYRQGAVVEPYLAYAIDLNVGWRSNGHPRFSAIERPLRTDSSHYSYEEKYLLGEGLAGAARELPAQLDGEVESRLLALTERVAQVVDLRGAPRVDFLLDKEGRLFVNEVNTIPGALGFYLWRATGVPYGELARGMLAEAQIRGLASGPGLGANGAALKRAGGIAAKLA